MEETHRFLVPNYYHNFSCKMGACRTACCEGWPVSISMKNYFYLLGIDCNKSLRDRLDRGLRVLDRPTVEEYARIEPRYDGDCTLRMPDGRCALQAELGESVLPDVCRLYPRGIRAAGDSYECSCSNSCEAVIELLFDREAPITFSFEELPIRLPPLPARSSFFEMLGVEQQIRAHLISVVEDRRMTLPQRLICLGQVLERMDQAFEKKDHAMLDDILGTRPCFAPTASTDEEVDTPHLQFGLQIARQMISILDDHSQSIRACGEAALAYFGDGEGAVERYETARAHFEELLPHWEVFYEHMLVNHMFFSQFPFQDRPESMRSEHIALCAVYAILRFLGIGCMAERQDKTILIDGMAAIFRLVDHTEFDRYASHLLRQADCTTKERLYELLSL